ncbi:MAG: TIGR04190 family B12-binding domain/radical SAM domain protein [Candidatus Methanomethylophilaceae archaeon]
MFGYDAVFIHAPSVYDFRKKPIFYGPISDVIPSSPVFEMYPIGFMTLSAHLQHAGYRTKIVNMAVRMLMSEKYDVEKVIRKTDSKVFFIDLHWMPHAHGALEIAKIVKKYHPESKVELGGFTSSYFWEELIQRPEVDFVMRGDSTEVPTVKLMEVLEKEGDLSEVPNLIWKDKDGRVHNNGVTHVPETLDDIMIDYGTMIKTVMKTMDVKSALPWAGWDKDPLTMALSVRGCSLNCTECGGSNFANEKVVCRKKPAFRSPEKLAEDIESIQSYMKAPVFVVGDIRQPGSKYAETFLKSVKERGIDNHVVLELFYGAGEEFFRSVNNSFEGGYTIEFSPDSHDESVRGPLGKGYSNEEVERTIQNAFGEGCSRMDLFYMTGLPFQTKESAIDSAKASKKLWSLVDKDDPLYIYNSPFSPFVDPGSKAFENPEKWGYTFFARTLEEHRRLLDSPSWKLTLSYETDLMTRDDIAEVSYDAANVLARSEHEAGRISESNMNNRIERTETARSIMHEVDRIMTVADEEERERQLWGIKEKGMEMMNSTIAEKDDLVWKSRSIWANSPRMLKGLLFPVKRS